MTDLLWQPSPEQLDNSQMAIFISQLNSELNLELLDYNDLHNWACENSDDFWAITAQKLGIQFKNPYSEVKTDTDFIDTEWFPGAAPDQ